MNVDICDACIRRTWLVESLAPFIEKVATREAGSRVRELLALDDESLIRAVTATKHTRLLEENTGLDVSACRALIIAAECWGMCRCSEMYPPGLRHPADAPAALIGLGCRRSVESVEPEECVTVVGARRASAYGMGVAEQLGRELAAVGLLVVSGMALGIDGQAHRGALERGASVGVLGCGPDVVYPRANRAVHRDLVERGAVISERPPGARPYRWAFPARNRIMAAMSGVTVVVEAMEGSGSLITADLAQQIGRELGAVPGPVTSSLSKGPNRILAEGGLVVRDAGDVIESIPGVRAAPLPLRGPEPTALAAEALKALELGALTPDAVVTQSGLDAAEVAGALTWLEISGYLDVSPTGVLQRTTLRLPHDDS